ncbi:MAG: DUF4302 domain-containing protein [Muribaculaceae bacterium]
MKAKIFKLLFGCVALLALSLQSCSNKEDEIFEESPSARLQALMDKTQATLVSSENGWVMDYFPDRDLSYGGFLYILKFTNQTVEAYCELSEDLTESIESLYRMTNDDGAVLTFDSYNEFLHFFATPSSGRYEAYDGDFEFKIMKVEDDLITVKGKRTGNTMYLHRLKEEPVQYLEKCVETSENIFAPEASGVYGGTSIEAYVDPDVRRITIYLNGGEYSEYYMPTPTGIRFVEPLEINGATISELSYDSVKFIFSGTDSKGATIQFTCVLPEEYMFFEEFEGDYRMYLSTSSSRYYVDVKLVPEGDHYILEGFHRKFNPVLTFVKAKGCLEMRSQDVGEYNGNTVRICAMGGGSLYPTLLTPGFFIKKDLTRENMLVWVPNDDKTLVWDGWLTWLIDSSGKSAGQLYNVNEWRWLATKVGTTSRYYLNSCLVDDMEKL